MAKMKTKKGLIIAVAVIVAVIAIVVVIILLVNDRQQEEMRLERGLMSEASLGVTLDTSDDSMLSLEYPDLFFADLDLTGAKWVFAQSLMSEDFRFGAYAAYDLVTSNNQKVGYTLIEVESGDIIELGGGICPVHRIKEKVLELSNLEFFYMVYRPARYEVCLKLNDKPNWCYYDELINEVVEFDPPIRSLEEGRRVVADQE
ncbi:MAG TPA: hypothetical protein GXZ81_03850 [Fastidiosipila sp.]|jgi:hypothetical protein|nr:hypothetical protein [Eubacteriales bacterium]MDD3611187.1 hypothetical protein [Eubacteriales bacterium]HHU04135.1 hypothetical protein [Fastidiosipila sp.]